MARDLPTQFKSRISETIAWCAAQPFVANNCTEDDLRYVWQCELAQAQESDPEAQVPVSIFRTPDLQPPGFSDSATGYAERRLAIATLGELRSRLLRDHAIAVPSPAPGMAPGIGLGKGRLLLYDPDGTDECGAAMVASAGYFDETDAPPWDTWIAYVREQPLEESRPAHGWDSYLVCWVPPALVSVVNQGIVACSGECLAWAVDRDCAFTRLLREAGVL
ncbi:MAG TPA: hypothetical protein VIG30_02755 [Ktedonobacterales bacterium]|jgi:hypothetical protein